MKSDIFTIVGCILLLLSIFIGVLSIRSYTVHYIDSTIILEIRPPGGMSPRLYIILLGLFFILGFLSLFVAIAILERQKAPLRKNYPRAKRVGFGGAKPPSQFEEKRE